MAVIGLLLVLAAVVGGTELVASNTASMDVEMFGNMITGTTSGLVFLAGAAAMLALVFGILLVGTGVGHRRRVRQEHRAEISQVKRTRGQLQAALAETAAENEQLRRELAEQKLATDTMGGVAVPPQINLNTEAARAGAVR